MRSKTDDLEELLQQNLKLRRDLVAEVARANKPRRVTGWGVVYWVGLVVIPILISAGLALSSATLCLGTNGHHGGVLTATAFWLPRQKWRRMPTEFDPDDLKAQLAKLDDYEIERRIERKMWEGDRLRVAQKVLKERIRSRTSANQTPQLLWELAAILGALIISLG